MKRVMAVLVLLIMVMSTSCSVLKSRMIPEPTLTTDESKRLVRDLLENNAGCRLPCWWGIKPGETTWVEARQLLEKVSLFISKSELKGSFYVDLQVQLPYPHTLQKYMEHSYYVENGIVEYIDVFNYDLAPNYSLPNFLKSYGQPYEVWIRTYPKADWGIIQHFIIDVFYEELGILAEYSTSDPMKEVQGNIQNCLVPEMDSPFFDLWSPESQKLSFQEAKKFIDTRSLPEPKPLLEATGMDVKTFYETFQNSETDVCLETPKRLWEWR
jgi:hypothetical protein